MTAYRPPLPLLCRPCARGQHGACEAETEIDLVARGVFPELPPGCGACACGCDELERALDDARLPGVTGRDR